MTPVGAFGQPLPPDWVKCPTCPQCGSQPAFPGILPWFCSDNACPTLTWDPEVDRATNLASAEYLHDPTACPLGGQPVALEPDPRCTCFPELA